jgi:cell division protein FtsL
MSPAPAAARSARTAPPTRRRRLTPVRPPRRISGPAPGRPRQPASSERRLPRPLRAVGRGATRVARHPMLDRLIRGRWSIGVIAFALIGIVTLQIGLLKLNVGIGRSLERERTLERENATLGIENAELASPERIRQLAARLGMSPVSLTELRFLRASHVPGGAAAAAARLHTPVHAAGESETHSAKHTVSEAGSEQAAGGESSSSESTHTETGSGEAGGSSEAGSSEATAATGESQTGETQPPVAGGGEAQAQPETSTETGTGG